MSTVIIGAAGAVGKRLTTELAKRGRKVIAVDRLATLPEELVAISAATEGSIDVRDPAALKRVFEKHSDVKTVWNLAAPLSVETAMDPAVAEEITVGGMRNVLNAMDCTGVKRICFTDSIGSFGATAPRKEATARWLTENPHQDSGSDYGKQKQGCRELMADFAANAGGDPRFAVLPGVLHSEAQWGGGTTEYALEALLHAVDAASSSPYVCPINPDTSLPMVHVSDLMKGLLLLQDAEEADLLEPQHGYNMAGFSFAPNQLFAEIKKYVPEFNTSLQLDENMDTFASLWPDALSSVEAERDLGYMPEVGLAEMVRDVLSAHAHRKEAKALAETEPFSLCLVSARAVAKQSPKLRTLTSTQSA